MAVKSHMNAPKFQFCRSCGGLLLPKDHKKYLKCIVCGMKQVIPNKTIISNYEKKTSKTLNRELKEKIRSRKTIIVEKEPMKKVSITEEEREAMEDLFLKE